MLIVYTAIVYCRKIMPEFCLGLIETNQDYPYLKHGIFRYYRNLKNNNCN